jgi:Ca2+:H+ antiporter
VRLPRLFDLPVITLVVPLAACGLLLSGRGGHGSTPFLMLISLTLIATVLVAVYHAEIIAHRIGEPLGTLVLALAVTVIEVSLIVSMMLSGGDEARSLARDTVFATVMIICNGVIGICLLAGSIKHRILFFRAEGSSSALSVLAALTTLTLILPQFTTTTPGPSYSSSQLAFASLMSLILYLVFVFVQTVRHKDHFLSAKLERAEPADEAVSSHPLLTTAWASFVFLLLALVGVVGLAKQLSPAIKNAVEAISAPPAVIGIAIALLVLMPETLSALRAARRNQMQTSLNLALGSALATIGLSIPTVAVVAIAMGIPLDLGLPAKEIVLLALTLLVGAITVIGGQATVMQGVVHLVLFAAFLFLAIVP